MNTVADREHPLAMYLFTQDMRWANRVMQTQQFGGCINLPLREHPYSGKAGETKMKLLRLFER